MDPNQALAYMLLNMNSYVAQIFPHNWAQAPQIAVQPPRPVVVSPDPTNFKKYHRTWKKHQIEEIFSLTSKYCQNSGRSIEDLGVKDFEVIAKGFEQSPEQVMNKINEINKSGTLRPGIWSQAEDEMLSNILKKGVEKWGQIANLLNKEIHKGLKIRTGKQCKERWNNYLNPAVNRGAWTVEEDVRILENYKNHGNKWSVISKAIANRTESSVKNRIKSLLNKIKQDLSTMDNLNSGIDRMIQSKVMGLSPKEEIQGISPRSGFESNKGTSQLTSLSFSQACQKVEEEEC